MIPDAAIVTDQSRKLVWVVNRENKTEQRPVEIGPIVDGLRVIPRRPRADRHGGGGRHRPAPARHAG